MRGLGVRQDGAVAVAFATETENGDGKGLIRFWAVLVVVPDMNARRHVHRRQGHVVHGEHRAIGDTDSDRLGRTGKPAGDAGDGVAIGFARIKLVVVVNRDAN
jgi:hypothetical protein